MTLTPPRRFVVVLGTLFAALTLGIGSAQAVSISLTPADAGTIGIGDPVSFDIQMDFTDDPTVGGGFDVFFDPGILSFVDWSAAGLGDPGFTFEPDILADELNGIAFGDFGGLTGPALVGTVTFMGAGVGTAVITLADNEGGPGNPGPFFSASTFEQQVVDYSGASVQVVPLPAAVWFFGSALLALVPGFRRRRLFSQ